MMMSTHFHMSLPCLSISQTKEFYVNILGAKLGRNTQKWLDIDLFGNQLTFIKSGGFDFTFKSYRFEDTVLPSFHFGVIIDKEMWNTLYQKLSASSHEITTEVTFLKDEIGEHQSFFISDPNNFTVEFKCFVDQSDMFKK